MKKLVLLILAVASLSFGQDLSRFDRFKRTTETGIDVWYAFCEAPVAFIDTPIPQEGLDYVFGLNVDENGVETPRVVSLTLNDFSLSITYSADRQTVIIALGASEYNPHKGRFLPVNAYDLMVWEKYMTAYGFPVEKWIEVEAFQALRNSPKYQAFEQ